MSMLTEQLHDQDHVRWNDEAILNGYIAVDDIPSIALGRDEIREQAWDTIRQREQQVRDGRVELIPLTVDALSTARLVLDARDSAGEDNPIYLERLAGLELDCLRLVAEWYRKKRPEYFPKSRHFFDAETGDFYSHGLSIRQMTENALTPIDNDPEEVERRVNERVENETPRILHQKLGSLALDGIGIRTISECTDKAISDFQYDQQNGLAHRGYNGYVPEIEKLMVRDIRIEPESGDRLEEQVGLRGDIIQHYMIQEALRRRGVETKGMGKTELHGTQLLVKDDLIDFVELLDTVACEEWCTPIFMGEPVDLAHPRDYSTIREESMERQEGLKEMAHKTAVFIVDLAESDFDRRKAPAHVEEFVKKLLLETAKQDSVLAEQMFDKETAQGLAEVARLESQGDFYAADRLMQTVEAAAPGGGFCGAGSCGLENINLFSDEGAALKKALRAETGDTVLKDKVRSCTKCNQKGTIAYAYNSRKVNKFCTNCSAFESSKGREK